MTARGAIQVRRYRRDDLPAVVELIRHTVKVSYVGVYSAPAIHHFLTHQTPETIAGRAEHGYMLVAVEGERIVGSGCLHDGRINRLYVDPRRQGRGLGKRIMRRLLAQAKRAGLRRVGLGASLSSRRFYESFGFEVKATRVRDLGRGHALKWFEMDKPLLTRGGRSKAAAEPISTKRRKDTRR